ncbi:ERF family protein [Desulfocurvibacter africanus]|uniref:ERF family protein n=1 Tax=Desulfocurvibacter africanus TaxID=873 RepID=UPI00040C2963|nr:ERF family protein [Desulfocurvibacter africanus]
MDASSYCSPEIKELAKALINVQHTLQPALKDRENTFAKSRYATLNSVMDSCREALLSNGIWVTQYPVPADPGHLGLVTKLTHAESGQWQSSLLVMPLPKTDPQGYGSGLTYARRYALSAMLGMVSEDDDDAELATHGQLTPRQRSTREQRKSASKPVPQSQISTIPNDTHPALAAMPKLDGISYKTASAQDGRLCIVATGNVSAKQQVLRASGFKWNEERKMWWRYADSA